MPKYQVFTIDMEMDSIPEAIQCELSKQFKATPIDKNTADIAEQIPNKELPVTLWLINAIQMDNKGISDIFEKLSTLPHTLTVLYGIAPNTELCTTALELGAFDILPKEIEPTLFSHKLKTLGKLKTQYAKTSKKLADSQTVALDAMKDSAELGHAMHLINGIFSCSEFDEISIRLFEAFKKLDIRGSMILFHDDDVIYFSDDGEQKDVEIKLCKAHYRKRQFQGPEASRFFTFNNRILTFSDSIAILVRNADEERQGRLRDILGAIIIGLDAHAHAIFQQQKDEKRANIINRMMETVKTTVVELEKIHEEKEQQTQHLIEDFNTDMFSTLSALQLSEEQEQHILDLSQNAMIQLLEKMDSDGEIKNNIENIIVSLRSLNQVI